MSRQKVTWITRIQDTPDFTTMEPEILHEWFISYRPAGSGPLRMGAAICKLILSVCELRGIDTSTWMEK